jgi:hypothetical protein
MLIGAREGIAYFRQSNSDGMPMRLVAVDNRKPGLFKTEFLIELEPLIQCSWILIATAHTKFGT